MSDLASVSGPSSIANRPLARGVLQFRANFDVPLCETCLGLLAS
jgi:hypothetical protein